MRAFRVVGDQIVIQVLLHLFQGLLPFGALLDTEVRVQQGAQPLNEAAALWPPNLGGAMLDIFELKAQLIGMLVLTAAEFSAVVAEHRADLGVVGLAEGQYIIVEDMYRCDGNLLVYGPRRNG